MGIKWVAKCNECDTKANVLFNNYNGEWAQHIAEQHAKETGHTVTVGFEVKPVEDTVEA